MSMLNRKAETLFWLGRYMERVENHARLIDVNYHMRHELKDPQESGILVWEKLIQAVGDYAVFVQQNKQTSEGDVLHFMTFERKHNNSIFSCVSQARDNARTIKEAIPGESWDIINAFYIWLKEQNLAAIRLLSPYVFYQKIKEWVALFHGSLESTMLRSNEWHFIQLGKYMERAENTVRILQVIYRSYMQDASKFTDHDNYQRMIAVLKSVSAYEAFRKMCANDIHIEKIVQFLMLNFVFPRSVSFSLVAIETHLKSIRRDLEFTLLSDQAIRFAGKTRANLAYLEWEDPGNDGLPKLLEEMSVSCNKLGEVISKTFFRKGVLGT
jgi:uncharacterized alpha-E superfamily protein